MIEDGDAQPIADEDRQQLLEPFLAAAQMTLAEMAGAEIAVRTTYCTGQARPLGDLVAVLRVTSPTLAALALHFPQRTAALLAGRVLAGVAADPDEGMVRDCLGEIANVTAGQAKALLLGTPHHFLLSTPTVIPAANAEVLAIPNAKYLTAILTSELGDLALQLCVSRDPAG